MNRSLFLFLVTAGAAGAIAWRVMAGPVLQDWAWTWFGVNQIFGNLGALAVVVLTFPVLRRFDLFWKVPVAASFLLLLPGTLLAVGYPEVQALREAPAHLTAAQVATLSHDAPHTVFLSGVWRKDLPAHGTYVHTTRDNGREFNPCTTETRAFCREPVVGDGWKPGDPVLAVAGDCEPRPRAGSADPRSEQYVALYPADDEGSLGLIALEDADRSGVGAGTRSECTFAPDDTHPDLRGAPWRFDAHHGFFVVKLPERDPQPVLTLYALLALGALAVIGSEGNRTGRVLRRAELPREDRR